MASTISARNISTTPTGLSPPATGGGGAVNTPSSSKQQQKGGGGGTAMETGATDPVLLAVWGCGGIPCQASVHDRVSGKIHRQPIGGDDLGGGGGGGSDPSGASSCFVAVPRQGFLFAATKSIAEHFYPNGNGVIADSGPTTRLWYSVEIPQTVTFEPLPGPKGSNNKAGGGRDRSAPGRLSIRLPTGTGPQHRGGIGGGAAANQQHIVNVGGGGRGGGGGGGGGGTGQTLKVSATTPFGVVLDELRTLLEDSVMTSPVFASLPQNYKTNGIRAFVDLPIKIVLNVDDAPPSDLLTVGAMTYDRDASMMLRQSQKEATASMFAGSVAPLLMIEPSVLDNLKYAGSSKSLDPAPFLSVKREIISRGLAVLAKNHANQSDHHYAEDATTTTSNHQRALADVSEGGISRQATSIGIRQGSGNGHDDVGIAEGGGDAAGGSGDQHPLVIRFHIVTPVNMTVRDLTAEALAKAAGAAAAASSRPAVQDGDTSNSTTFEMNLETGLYEPTTTPNRGGNYNYPSRLIGSMSRFLAAESTKSLDAPPTSTSSLHEVGMPPIPSTIVRRVLPSYTIGDLHIKEATDGGSSPLLPSAPSNHKSSPQQQQPYNVEIATRAQSLSRLGDVLRAFIVPFASLTDSEISADSPLPPRFGSGTLTPPVSYSSPSTTPTTHVIGSTSSSSMGAGQPVVAASSARPRVLVFGVEPSMCVPISALYASMSAMDLALHITIDFTGCDNRYYIPETMSNCNHSLTTKIFSSSTSTTTTLSESSTVAERSLSTWQRITSTRFTQHAQTLYSLHPSQSSSSSRGQDHVKGYVCECGPSLQHYRNNSALSQHHGSVLLAARDSTFLLCYAGLSSGAEGGEAGSTTTAPTTTSASSSSPASSSTGCCWNPHCVFGLPLGAVNLPAHTAHQSDVAGSTSSTALPRGGGHHQHLIVDSPSSGVDAEERDAGVGAPTAVKATSNATTDSAVVVLDTATIPPPAYLPFVDVEGAIVRRLPMFVCVMPDARRAWIRYQHATSLASIAAKSRAADARHASGGGGVMLPPRRHRSGGTTNSPKLNNNPTSPPTNTPQSIGGGEEVMLGDTNSYNENDADRNRASSEFVRV